MFCESFRSSSSGSSFGMKASIAFASRLARPADAPSGNKKAAA
jgi:hypothetical protein